MINKEEFEKCSVKENLDFIKKILRLATHNAFTKDDLLFLIKVQNEIIETMKCCGNCEHFYCGSEKECPMGHTCMTIDMTPCNEWELVK